MIGLIKKDFYMYLASGQLKYFSLFVLLYAVLGIVTGNISFLTSAIVAFTAVIPINNISLDQGCHWDTFAVTMPIRRRDIVISKYVTSIGLVIVGEAICIFCSLFTKTSLKDNVLNIITVLAVFLIWLSISYPIIFKLGIERGKLIIIGIIVMPVVIGAVIGDKVLDFLARNNGFVQFFESYGYLILFMIGIVCYIVSVFISIKIFEGKDL